MAQVFQVKVYGVNGSGFGPTTGTDMAFPSAGVVLRTIDPPVNYQGTDCNTSIQLLPTGLTVNAPQYYTDEVIADVVTLANA